MGFYYYAGSDAVKGLQKVHDKGEKVSKNTLKKLEGVILKRLGGGQPPSFHGMHDPNPMKSKTSS